MLFPKLKARIDAKILPWLESKPLHERDQILEVIKSNGGTARYIKDMIKRAVKHGRVP